MPLRLIRNTNAALRMCEVHTAYALKSMAESIDIPWLKSPPPYYTELVLPPQLMELIVYQLFGSIVSTKDEPNTPLFG